MKIETKYNIGDKVYFMFNNKVDSGIIDNILIQIYNARVGESEIEQICDIQYVVLKDYKKDEKEEKDCFPTKEELLASL